MKQTPRSAQDILQSFETRWNSCASSSRENLLRLVVLRELTRMLHSEKSWCLASGFPDEAQQYHEYEMAADKLVNEDDLSGSLSDILAKAEALPDPDPVTGVLASSSRRKFPKELQGILPSEKIERFDRHWEKALVCEAMKLHWEIWLLKANVRIEAAQDCENGLTRELGDRGILLFADSAETNELQEGIWPGQWLLLSEPGFDCRRAPLHSVKGLIVAPNPPQWTLVHRS